MKTYPTIADEIRKGARSQGAELAASDVGRTIAPDFGRVQRGDIGKRVWLRDYGVSMENNEQRDARKANAPSSYPIAPPAEIYAVVKVTRCAGHEQQSVQGAQTDADTAKAIAHMISPFGACKVCTYEARRYILAE